MMLARIRDEMHGDVPVVSVEGEIDATNIVTLGERLRTALSNLGTALIVDLTQTTYLDSAGLNLLFQLAGELHQRQQQLHLVVVPASPIARVVAIVGLDVVVPTHATTGDALAQTAN